MNKLTLIAVVVASLRLMACGGLEPGATEEMASLDQNLDLLDQGGLLAFVNDQAHTSLDTLDTVCEIRSHAAANIIAHRDGPDGLPGTADDDLYDDLAELEAIKWVGEWTMEQLYTCANDGGYLFGDRAGFMAFLNDPATTFDVLDVDCAIRSDSAANVIARRDGADGLTGTADDRPFGSLADLDSVVMVGLWTIDRLYACADERGYLGDSPTQDPGVEEPVCEDPDGMTEEWTLANLDPTLQALIQGDLYDYAYTLRDQSRPFEVRFAVVYTYTCQGAPMYHEVRYVQYVDPECGVQLHIVLRLDLDYQVTDAYAII